MLPNTGKSFRGSNSRAKVNSQYAAAIAKALRKQLGLTHQATKTIMRWTGASERSAKNWQSGAIGPSGAYLIILMSRSEEVLTATLGLAGRKHALLSTSLSTLRDRLHDVVHLLDRLE
jgi:hypothetical protein